MASDHSSVQFHLIGHFVDFDDACFHRQVHIFPDDFFLGNFDDLLDDDFFVHIYHFLLRNRLIDFVDYRDLDDFFEDDFFVDDDLSWDFDDFFDDVLFLFGSG